MNSRKPAPDAPTSVLTVGHSIHPIDEFIDLLRAHGVQHIVDVRTLPRSRRHPQFEQEALRSALEPAGIAYTHLPGLGGLRHARRDSLNTGWRNDSFRGYADYMQTAAYAQAIAELVALGARQRVAVMCAEALPWRCHRSLIADTLTVQGIPVEHIMSRTQRKPHAITPFARVDGHRITYPGQETQA